MDGHDPGPVIITIRLSRVGAAQPADPALPASYIALAAAPLAGEFKATVQLPPLRPMPELVLEQEQISYGAELYRALLGNPIGGALRGAINQAILHDRRVSLRLMFDPDATDAARLPWEMLHDGNRFLVRSAPIDLIRHIAFDQALPVRNATAPYQVLLVAPAPAGREPPDIQGVRAILAGLPNLAVHVVQPATYDTLRRWQTKVDVFCYIGHGGVGKGRGGFFFEDEGGQADFVAAEDVADLLNRLRVSFAVLYSCYGGTVGGQSIFLGVAPAIVRAGVPGAVAMQGEILIKPSLAFLEAIFRAISQPRPITEAVAQAREALFRSEEWFRPALYLRSADDDARLFLPAPPAPPVDLVTPVAPPPPLSPTDVPPQRLMDVMSRAFQSNGEFDRLLWEIDIRLSRHQLAGETLGEKLIALYRWCDERQRYADLVEAVIRLRPAYRDEILAPV